MLSVDSHRVAHNFLQGCDYDRFKMSLQKLIFVLSCTSLAWPLTFLLNQKDWKRRSLLFPCRSSFQFKSQHRVMYGDCWGALSSTWIRWERKSAVKRDDACPKSVPGKRETAVWSQEFVTELGRHLIQRQYEIPCEVPPFWLSVQDGKPFWLKSRNR